MAKNNTHAMIQSVNGSNHVKTLHAAPSNTDDLLSLVVPINHKHQLTVWFSKEVPVEMAQSMANNYQTPKRNNLLPCSRECYRSTVSNI